MIKVENIGTWGFEHAIRGMRNPYNSWGRGDSYQSEFTEDGKQGFVIGKNDLNLMRSLYDAGSEHRKYLRQIFVGMDIIAPLYWWKEFDTYKIGVTANSCSTMHTIHKKEFELDDFSYEHLRRTGINALKKTIDALNAEREAYVGDGLAGLKGDKQCWYSMIQLLPSSYNQRRTVTMNYENVANIIDQRTWHKLDEWNAFVDELKKLPYVNAIMSGVRN